jgi:hypothetical protein
MKSSWNQQETLPTREDSAALNDPSNEDELHKCEPPISGNMCGSLEAHMRRHVLVGERVREDLRSTVAETFRIGPIL